MDIVEALQKEEAWLQKQLTGIQGAIAVLNGSGRAAVSPRHASNPARKTAKRTMSAAVRAKIAPSVKARWAKIRAEKAKKAK
jgi:hypothetical protein